jgi:hypothetical protein
MGEDDPPHVLRVQALRLHLRADLLRGLDARHGKRQHPLEPRDLHSSGETGVDRDQALGVLEDEGEGRKFVGPAPTKGIQPAFCPHHSLVPDKATGLDDVDAHLRRGT